MKPFNKICLWCYYTGCFLGGLLIFILLLFALVFIIYWTVMYYYVAVPIILFLVFIVFFAIGEGIYKDQENNEWKAIKKKENDTIS